MSFLAPLEKSQNSSKLSYSRGAGTCTIIQPGDINSFFHPLPQPKITDMEMTSDDTHCHLVLHFGTAKAWKETTRIQLWVF